MVSIFCFLIIGAFAQHHHHKDKRNDPHYRYSKMLYWGYQYKVAPRGVYVFPHSGVQYYYRGGIFYRPSCPKYAIVRAPIGVRVGALPTGNIHFVINGRNYFYYYGTYYVKSVDDREYITVSPPVGAVVDALPDGYDKVNIDGKTYYHFEGIYYKAVINKSGDVRYEAVDENKK